MQAGSRHGAAGKILGTRDQRTRNRMIARFGTFLLGCGDVRNWLSPGSCVGGITGQPLERLNIS
jgi:hypothetical protein